MTSDRWSELEAVPEPMDRFRLTPPPHPSMNAFAKERLSSRAWTALWKLRWFEPDAVVCGDVDRLRAVIGVGASTLGEIARLRRRLIDEPG